MTEGSLVVGRVGGRRFARRAVRSIWSRPVLTCATAVIVAYVVVGLAAPLIAPYPYEAQSSERLLPPLAEGHFLGTDNLGRDVWTRLLYGARTSLIVAVGTTGIAMIVGLIMGAAAGYFRGKTDMVIGTIIDVVWSFPNLLVAIILVAVIAPGLIPVMIAVGITNAAGCARVVRGEALSLRERRFVLAAVAMGRSTPFIIGRHIVPNVVAPLLVMASFYMGLAIILEAAFGFVGLGAQPPLPSWGQMLAEGRQYLQLDHWLVTLPGVCIAVVVLAFNLLGDELRDLLDPRLRDGVR